MPTKLTQGEVARRLRAVGVTLLGRYRAATWPVRVRYEACGHTGHVRAANAAGGHGCRRCADRALRLSEQELTKRCHRAGLQLRSRYLGDSAGRRIRVCCSSCGREWRMLVSSLLRGLGCARCYHRTRSLPEKTVRARLLRRGLQLDGSYSGNSEDVAAVSCRDCGHGWRTRLCTLFNGGRCPSCYPRRFGVSEDEVREIVERITGWKFPPRWPEWLKGRSRKPLQLDGYNEAHQVAFEYQGRQHYAARLQFGGEKELAATKLRDARKRKLCQRHGVLLICVPYWKRDVAAFVQQKLAIDKDGKE